MTRKLLRTLVILGLCMLSFASCFLAFTMSAHAEVNTVTIRNGSKDYFGTFYTRKRYITHINGETEYEGVQLGGERGLAYCVEPTLKPLDDGTYEVKLIGPEATGKEAELRKLMYYLPGASGYYDLTQKSWFGEKWYTDDADKCSDYAIGHMALSYIYDDKSDSSDAWTGATEAMKKKTLSIVAALGKLANPPENFEAFIIKKTKKQAYMGSIYTPQYGSCKVTKLSANVDITKGNECYDLTGAQYIVYTDADCEDEAYDKDGVVAILTIGEDGKSNEVELETGNYYIKESAAPTGYAIDTKAHSIEIKMDSLTTYTAYDIPQSNPVNILLEKIDADTGLAVPQDGCSFAGAEFEMRYYAVKAPKGATSDELKALIADKKPAKIKGEAAVWTFKTDEFGRVDMQKPDKYLVKSESAELYKDSQGRYVIPVGIVTIKETKAPQGYVVNDEVFIRSIRAEGNGESLNNFQALVGDAAVKELSEPREEPIEGDVPKTGDSNSLLRWGILAVGAICLLAMLTIKRRGDRLKVETNETGRRYKK